MPVASIATAPMLSVSCGRPSIRFEDQGLSLFRGAADAPRSLPCVIFWGFNHFLVVEGFDQTHAFLSDPAQGRAFCWRNFSITSPAGLSSHPARSSVEAVRIDPRCGCCRACCVLIAISCCV